MTIRGIIKPSYCACKYADCAGENAGHAVRHGTTIVRREWRNRDGQKRLQSTNMTHPKPDRSNYTPNRSKTPENDQLDIGWNEGFMSDGRP